jgi:hypothetical protein
MHFCFFHVAGPQPVYANTQEIQQRIAMESQAAHGEGDITTPTTPSDRGQVGRSMVFIERPSLHHPTL